MSSRSDSELLESYRDQATLNSEIERLREALEGMLRMASTIRDTVVVELAADRPGSGVDLMHWLNDVPDWPVCEDARRALERGK